MEKPSFTGTLNDEYIKDYCSQSILINENFNEKNISQACYELTAGSIYYDLENPNHRIDIEEEEYDYILIKPHQTIVIITNESLNLPNYILGRILSKGSLFSIGLLPVNTYADPGFRGNLGIVLRNSSTNFLKIKKMDSIAKIEFSVLHEEVQNDYDGQHGFKSKIWPVPYHYILKEKEIKKDQRINSTSEEIQRMYGVRYSQVIGRLVDTERKLLLAATLYFILILLIIGTSIYFSVSEQIFQPFVMVSLGLLVNLISGLYFWKLGK